MKILLGTILGIVLASIIGFLAIKSYAKRHMLMETAVQGTFEEVVAKLDTEVKARGWKIPHVHDLQETMRKFDLEVRKVHVFEICKPDLAYQLLSLSEERVASSMMPCRIAVYEKADGKVYLSRMNSMLMARMMGGVIESMMHSAGKEVEEIIAAMAAKKP